MFFLCCSTRLVLSTKNKSLFVNIQCSTTDITFFHVQKEPPPATKSTDSINQKSRRCAGNLSCDGAMDKSTVLYITKELSYLLSSFFLTLLSLDKTKLSKYYE